MSYPAHPIPHRSTNRSPVDRPISTDRDGLCNEVVRGFETWIDRYDTGSQEYVRYSLRRFIRQYLRDTSYQPFAETISVPKRTAKCDLVIDDSIGVKIIHNLNAGSKEWIHKQLRSIFQNYDHLIIYGHQIAPAHLDIWYQIKRSLGRRSSRRGSIAVLQTVQRIEYRTPLTNRRVRKAVVHKTFVYLLFTAFVLAGGQFLSLTEGSNVMAQAYVGALIVFNVVVVLMGAFLVRSL
ncbi:hypothetical protein [Natrinema sp. 1APR25-10V2]|uniref:hypothetical protein n=1 Tax=Natrinema sp. 1APR25-10V2 TaxID=2951081 RepID=UPI0028760BE4|nr:hypothetical protein [Natrinema sp. 1APR25-10V2]MDS0475284.1 hypothetical protein [Natrinema sp. 1APR25-10V2]